MLRIAIRDDDVNYFTKVKELEQAYKGIIGRYPVGFAIVPFIHKSQFFMNDIKENNNLEKMKKLKKIELKMKEDEYENYYKNYYYLHRNQELVDYLKKYIEEEKIEIYLHGITHRFYGGGAEFSKDMFVPEEEIEFAKKYLEEILETQINYFVPPSNSICFNNIKKLYKYNLKLIISGWPISNNFFEKFYINFLKLKKINLKQTNFYKKNLFQYKIYEKKVQNCLTFSQNDSVDTFLKKYDLEKVQNDTIIIATHYTNHFDKNCLKNFIELLEYFERKGAKFYKISELS